MLVLLVINKFQRILWRLHTCSTALSILSSKATPGEQCVEQEMLIEVRSSQNDLIPQPESLPISGL